MRPLLSVLCLLIGSAGAAPAATLEVHTQPQVEVYWEGVLLATTDDDGTLVVEDVPEGPFELELRKAGYEPLLTTVEVGAGSTRWTRDLVALAPSAESPDAVPGGASSDGAATTSGDATAEAAAPVFRVSAGGWLALFVLLGALTWTLLRAVRSRRKIPAPASAPPPRVSRERASGRTFESETASAGGGTFLSDLRQRERAMDDLVDVSRPGSGAEEPSEGDVVDVSWKEVE